MHVVLLAYHYPPDPEVGGLRAQKVARAIASAGHSVTVVHAAYGKETAGLNDAGPVKMIPVQPARSLRDWYREISTEIRRQGKAVDGTDGSQSQPWRAPKRVGWPKRIVYSLMWLPDDRQGFIWRAARAAIDSIHRTEASSRTVLYSTSPPASAHLAALVASISTGVPWIMELRDPWTDNPGKPWYCRTAFTDRAEAWLERWCLAQARRVVAVSDGIAELASSKLTFGREKVLVVRNGIDELVELTPRRNFGPRRVLHVGTCYLGRDPRPFLTALAAVARRHALGPDDLQVEFVGKCEWFDGVSLGAVVKELGLAALVHFVPWLPHTEALRRIERADLLLLLAEGQPNQVPNKLYDYLGARRRMLVFADPAGETARMVRAVGGHIVTTACDSDLERRVEEALLADRSTVVGQEAVLRAWTTETQMRGLTAAVAQLERPL